MQQPMLNPEDITDPTTVMNMALVLMDKAFKLKYSTPTNNNQIISSNPHNRQIAQPGMNMGQDRQMQMVRGNGGNQFRQYAGQNVGNQNGYNAVQNEEAGIQLQDEEFDLMSTAVDLDDIEKVNANCILMANLQQALTSGTQTDKAPVYDSDGSAEQAQQKQQSLYNGKVLLEKHNPSAVYVSEETLELAQEKVDESLTKHKALELEIERLLRAVVNQDNMSIVQSNYVVDTSNLQTELEGTKERFENCIIKKENEYAKLWNDWYKKCEECKYDKILYDKAYNDMQQKIERLQAQLGDQKGKSKDTPCVSNTLDPLSQKLENKNVELEFQVRNYEKENAHLKTTYKNLFDSILVTWAQTKTIIDSLQDKLHDTIYKNAKLRAQLFDKVSEQKDTTKVTSNSIPTPQESKVVKYDNVIAPEMFRINPFKPYREEKVDNIAKTRRPQHKSNTKNDRVPFASKSSCSKNKEVEVEEHPTNLLLSKNKKHMSSECNTVKLAIQNDKSEVFLGTVRFGNDHVAAILGFNDLQWGNSLITMVYFVEGLGHNVFSVGQFCDSDLETLVESPIPVSPSSSVGSSSPVRSTTPPPDYPFDESIFAELDNSLWIIPRPLGSEPVPEEPDEMPPKRMSTSEALAMTQAAIKKLVVDSVSAYLESQATNMAYTDNTTRPREAPVARQCSYKKFMSCQTINFKGTEGAIGLIHWFERSELVFSHSNYTEDCKVKFATSTLTKDALSWWNYFA
ncbi:hypothetical protein Tco_0782054 [Tanacetum coccineum]